MNRISYGLVLLLWLEHQFRLWVSSERQIAEEVIPHPLNFFKHQNFNNLGHHIFTIHDFTQFGQA